MRALVLALVVLPGCTLMAHDHACYPFLAHQFGGHVPAEVMRTLAHERGTRKEVGRARAPVGFYYRRAPPATVDDMRTVVGGDYELARCPADPRLRLGSGAEGGHGAR